MTSNHKYLCDTLTSLSNLWIAQLKRPVKETCLKSLVWDKFTRYVLQWEAVQRGRVRHVKLTIGPTCIEGVFIFKYHFDREVFCCVLTNESDVLNETQKTTCSEFQWKSLNLSLHCLTLNFLLTVYTWHIFFAKSSPSEQKKCNETKYNHTWRLMNPRGYCNGQEWIQAESILLIFCKIRQPTNLKKQKHKTPNSGQSIHSNDFVTASPRWIVSGDILKLNLLDNSLIRLFPKCTY